MNNGVSTLLMSLILVTTIFSQGFLVQDAYSGVPIDTTEPDTTIDSSIKTQLQE